ncbi:MAG TPA: serine/threonine-protein kinase [Candidatus Limnocylindrales bacterium]|nr:serine/threonine-protein kinase [Candidatus Limnocylindrales bacterium]
MAGPRDGIEGLSYIMASIPTEGSWRRLDSLFQQALDRPAEERQKFLDAATAGDPDLRRYLEEMLEHARDAGAQIAGSIATLAQSAVLGGMWAGRRVGSYRIVREIGRGGMGIVFEAARDDSEYRKTVALKLLPAWRDLPNLRERFRNERQILAGLDHPNIARFLEGGTEDGIPYFVMEYVDGMPLAQWRGSNTSLRETLNLFRQICAAVHYAHENLVVHRDLKPANILVNREGVPKLLDFGIAKLVAPVAGDGGTTTELRHWTPDYASPEQVRGSAITVRTDVYSLGLILYELLCGERAQVADGTSPLALDRSICEADAPLPSVRAAVTGNGLLAKQLCGDLDTIVAKAISKDPQRRYSSAAALSADIERHLNGHPVAARPATMMYRIGKLVRRRRLAFAAAALVVATGTAGIVSTVHQKHRVERRFQEVRGLATALVFDVHDRIEYLPGATEARKAIVATGLRYLASLREDAASDSSLALELAAAYMRIGDVQGHPLYGSLHDTDGASASYATAKKMIAPLYGAHDGRAQVPMASVEYREALLDYLRGNATAAMATLNDAERIAWAAIGRSPRDTEALSIAGDISSQRVRIASDHRQPEIARQAAERTLDAAQRLAALQPGSRQSLDYLAEAQSSLGAAYRTAGQLEESVRRYRDAAATREQLVSLEPQNTSYRRVLMISYGHVGDGLGPARNQGLDDLEGASQAYGKAVAIAREMVRQDAADRTARSDLANAEYRAGDVLLVSPGHASEALAILEESERGFSALLKDDPGNERCRFMMLFAQRKQGEALEALGRDAEATRVLVSNRVLAQSFAGTKDAPAARAGAVLAGVRLARIKARAGDGSALTLVNRVADEIRSRNLEIAFTPWAEPTVYADLGRVYQQLGAREQASIWLEKSLACWRALKLPAVLEAKRAAEVKAVEASLAER